jgi:tetratricopeptide (TPR) repeat protein
MAFTPDRTQLVIATNMVLHVWNLRLLREQLAHVGLDWDLPSYGKSPHEEQPAPREIKVELSADSYFTRGDSLLHRRKLNLAIADFHDALKRDSSHDRACNELAWIYATGPLEIRDPAKAVELAKRAVARRGNRAVYLNTLGVAYYRAGQWANAVLTLNAAGNANPRGLTAWDLFFLAMSYKRLGNIAEAHKCYEQAVAAMKNAKPEEMEELNAFRTEASIVLQRAGS